jgi:hypothetical protein
MPTITTIATHYKPIWNIKVIDENGNENGWAARGDTVEEALQTIIDYIKIEKG